MSKPFIESLKEIPAPSGGKHIVYVTEKGANGEVDVVPTERDLPYVVEVFNVYIPTKNKLTGDDDVIRSTVRRMFLTSPLEIGTSGFFRVTAQVSRKNRTVTHTVSVIPWKEQPWHTNPDGASEPWYIIENHFSPVERKLTTEQVFKWLTARLGDAGARDALNQLYADPPSNG